jgi:hypothetical protein
MLRCGDRLCCRVLVYCPSGEPDEWMQSDLTARVAELPRTELQRDDDARIAARLGCATSGSVVLFDAGGTAGFWGGLTPARGHAGDNLGSDSVLAIVSGETPPRRSTPVYGCDLGVPVASGTPKRGAP